MAHDILKNIKIIGFDADDTLWQNESLFRAAERDFYALLAAYAPAKELEKIFFEAEMQNLPLYGYGVKAFTLSMLETALKVSGHKIEQAKLAQIIALGRGILQAPLVLLEGVADTLSALPQHYTLVVATKGDLLDQNRKMQLSGLAKHFSHVEVMHEKDKPAYQKLLRAVGGRAENFLMIGNSLKSDILPVLGLGGRAIHIPHADTWAHEHCPPPPPGPNFLQLKDIKDLLEIV